MNIHIVSQPQCFPDGTPEKETWRVSHQTGKQKADSNFHPVLLDHTQAASCFNLVHGRLLV